MASSASSEPTSARSTLVTVVAIAVAVIAIFAGMNSYGLSVDNAKLSPDSYGAARAQVRFADVLVKIPPGERVGYFTDLDPNSALHTSEFLAVQYALAPRQLLMLGPATQLEWAVANFSKPQDYSAAGASRGYELVTDFGNGVVLYRRKAS